MRLMRSHTARTSLAALCVGVLCASAVLTVFAYPRTTHAFPWGGQFQQVIPCFNNVIWTLTGPPRGGKYIWVPGVTRTYDYGPPSHAGQWGIGLAAPPYFCIVSPLPLIVFPGIIMTMLGSSQ